MNYSRKRLCKPRADEGISFHQFPGLFFFNGDLVVSKIFIYLILTVQDLGGCLGFSLVAMSRGGAWAFHCGTFSCCKARLWGAQASVVGAHGLGCFTTCGILVPVPGIEPVSPASAGGFFTTEAAEKPLQYF